MAETSAHVFINFFRSLELIASLPQSTPGVTLIYCGLINKLQND